MAKREFLMLAHNFEEHYIGGWWVSEKLDGQRAFWDGGISRGTPAAMIPWANIERDGRYKKPPIATGLWTRYGNVIHAPDWWLAKLPRCTPLDGELYMGRGTFQDLRSIVSTLEPGYGWKNVKYYVFDSPPTSRVFADGKINTTNFKREFRGIAAMPTPVKPFREFYEGVLIDVENDVVVRHYQSELPQVNDDAIKVMNDKLDVISSTGGEGLIIRRPSAIWVPERTWDLLKVKKLLDAEAEVVGFKFGKHSDNTRTVSGNADSKLLGMMGCLSVKWRDKVFDLSGFTDAERKISDVDYAIEHPGEAAPAHVKCFAFPVGTKVTFRYTELSKEGIPLKARYWRKES